MIDPEAAFDASMKRRLPRIEMRPETIEDAGFLIALHIACSPMADMLPEAMLIQQAELANRGFRAASSTAMRRIAIIERQPVGRIIVDWHDGANSHGIDIAVMPHSRKTGLGLYMLQSWIGVADSLGRCCTLDVLAHNPARKIYERLGFLPTANMDESYAVIKMLRAVRISAPD